MTSHVYRPDIDGLRALAARAGASVIDPYLYHGARKHVRPGSR